MNDEENAQNPEWPREVFIKKTLDAIAVELGDDYDEDDDNGLVADAIMTSATMIEIESWEAIPKGYELVDKYDQAEYDAYCESKQRK